MRRVIKFVCVVLLFILLGAVPVIGQEVSLYEVLPQDLDRPLGVEFSHEGSSKVYILSRTGYIERFDKNDPEGTFERWFELPMDVFLLSEGGLLGLTFHPDFPENNSFFVYFTYDDEGQFKSRLSRFRVNDGAADEESEEIILEFDQPASNHNGGALEFGPDGYLYISSGDGGGSGSRDNSQDLTNLLGAILRIDINTDEGYLIPPDNPLIDDPEAMDEIFAWGLRHPWRMSFDPVTGHLWVADVGPSSWEVIHIVENGKNYGYPIIVGSHCRIAGCDKTGLEMPVFEYEWGLEDTGRSITGGYVYRGSTNPSLYGKYIYGDFVSGRIWALEVDHDTWEVFSNTEIYHADFNIPSFGIDSDREIYTIGWGDENILYRFMPDENGDDPVPPSKVELSLPENGATGESVDPVLSWDQAAQGTGYRVQVATDSEFSALVLDQADVSETELEATGLDYETTYYWRVRASNEAGAGEWSDVWSFTTEDEPVEVPGVVVLVSPEDGAMDVSVNPVLNWEITVHGTRYTVQVGADSEFGTVILDEGGLTQTEFEASGLAYETTYYWRVRASNEAGDGEWSDIWSFTTQDEPVEVPGVVVLVSPEDGASGEPLQPELMWQSDADAETYDLQLSMSSDVSSPLIDQAGLTEAGFTPDDPLAYETTYYWRVRASNEAGDGVWSAVWSFTTQHVPVIGNLELTENGDSVELSWNLPVAVDIAEFRIYRGPTVSEMQLLESVPAGAQQYADTDLPEGAALYAVTLLDIFGVESNFSNVVSFYNSSVMATQNWKLVSIPVDHEGVEIPGSTLFGFDRVYRSEPVLKPGKGYWVKSINGEGESEQVEVRGAGLEQNTLSLKSGWNMVGGLIDKVAVSSIGDPLGILTSAPVYRYNNGAYQEVSVLEPAAGYWIYAQEEGEIDLEISSEITVVKEATQLAAIEDAEPDRIVFTREGREFTFRASATALDSDRQYRYLMPPRAPGNILDIRTAQGFRFSDRSSELLELTTPDYPVGVAFNPAAGSEHVYRLIAEEENGTIVHINLMPGQKQSINKEYEKLTLERIHRDEAILKTSIDPNYPNPFNPATTIRYRIAQQSEVLMDVYDVAGRRVARLVNSVQQPGAYTVQFDGSGLASGVYFLRLQTNNFVDVQKLTLIK